MDRRNFLTAVLAIGAATPAAAFVGPANEAPEAPAMPDWWRKLTANEKIMLHVEAMMVLIKDEMPPGAEKISATIGYDFTDGSQTYLQAMAMGCGDRTSGGSAVVERQVGSRSFCA